MQQVKQTPEAAAKIFSNFIFSLKQDKTPSLKKGETWDATKALDKILMRGLFTPLGGIDCGQCGIVVVDIDSYKLEFQNSPAAKAFAERVRKISKYSYKTPRGGEHHYFKGYAKSYSPHPGVDIKSTGGYIAVYDNPAKDFKDFDTFYKSLPYFSEIAPGKTVSTAEAISGPGESKNNPWIPKNTFGNIDKNVSSLIKLINANKGRTIEKQKAALKDFLSCVGRKQKITKEKEEESPFYTKTDTLDPVIYKDLTKTQTRQYIDEHRFFIKNHYILTAGEAGIGKSGAIISYLLQQGCKILIDSNGENTATLLKEYAKLNSNTTKHPKSQGGCLIGFPLSDLHKKEVYDKLVGIIEKHKIDTILEDPAHIPDRFSTEGEKLREFLDGRQKFAEEFGLCWIIIRNHSKDAKSYTDFNKVKGGSEWGGRARLVISCVPIQPDSEGYLTLKKEWDGKGVDYETPKSDTEIQKMSLLFVAKCNYIQPKKWLVATIRPTPKTYEFVTQRDIYPVEIKGRYWKDFCMGETKAGKQKKKDNTFLAFDILLEYEKENKEGLSSGKWKALMMKELKIGKTAAQDIIQELGKNKYVEGGGSGPKSKPYKTIKTGRDAYKED